MKIAEVRLANGNVFYIGNVKSKRQLLSRFERLCGQARTSLTFISVGQSAFNVDKITDITLINGGGESMDCGLDDMQLVT